MDHLRNALRRYLADEPYRRLTDDELWARFRDHREESAFRVLLEKTGGLVQALCRSVLGNDAEAEEAFQETYAALFRDRAKLPSYPAAVAWLMETARNKARMQRRWRLRLTWRERQKAAVSPTTTDEAACGLADQERSTAVIAAVASLPTRERRAVELVYLSGMSHTEAAAVLGWSRGTVGTYVQRGLERLRQTPGLREGVTGAVLTAALANAPGLTSERLAAVAEVVWTKAAALPPSPGGFWTAGKVKAVAGVMSCIALATGGMLVNNQSGTTATQPSATVRPHTLSSPPEPVPERDLRVFRADVLPRIRSAFRDLLIGDGEVVLESLATFDTRVDCTLALNHKLASGVKATSRIRMIHEVDRHATWVAADPYGQGDWRTIDRSQPIILWQNPLTRKGIVVHTPALEQAIAAFDRLPRDDQTAALKAATDEQLRTAFQPYLGYWYVRGDSSLLCKFSIESGDVILDYQGARAEGLWRYRLEPDGSIRTLVAISAGHARFLANGQRIEFPESGEWWSREPTPQQK